MVDRILGVYKVTRFKGTCEDLVGLFSECESYLFDITSKGFSIIAEFPVAGDMKEQIRVIKEIDKGIPKSSKKCKIKLISIIVQKKNIVKTVVGFADLSKTLLQLFKEE